MEAAHELESLQDAVLRMLKQVEYAEPRDQPDSQHPIHILEHLVSSLFKDRNRLATENLRKDEELGQMKSDLESKSISYSKEKEQLTSELAAVKLGAEKSKKEATDYSTFLESEVESSKVIVSVCFLLPLVVICFVVHVAISPALIRALLSNDALTGEYCKCGGGYGAAGE